MSATPKVIITRTATGLEFECEGEVDVEFDGVVMLTPGAGVIRYKEFVNESH